MLFVEGFYLQAESKYYAIIILALALVQSSSSQEYTGFINEWISYCLMNIAFCRVNRCIGNKKVVSPVDELIIDSYVGEGLHSLDFMEASLRFHCGHLTRYKKLQLLESLDR